jgi:hypothetical protein
MPFDELRTEYFKKAYKKIRLCFDESCSEPAELWQTPKTR